MKSKLSLLIFIIILSALTYFAYPIIKSRYFNHDSELIITNQKEGDSKAIIEDKIAENENEIQPTFESSSLKISINPSDCDNECFDFKKNDELEYCQEVCGLSKLENTEEPANCESKTSLQKDYCLKYLGIAKKDFKICNQISDAGIKKTCQNRITEDIMENQ